MYSLQWLRALAATLVVARHVAVHATGAHGPAFDVGQIGVDIFFVISGFVIYLTGRNLEWHVFARRRVARIVPLYWLATIAAVLATARSFGEPYWLSNALSAFLFIPAHDTARTIWPPVMAGWTLNFEMYFYAVCVFVLAFVPRRFFLPATATIIGLGILVGAPSLLAYGTSIRPAPMILMLPISIEFIVGMLLAKTWKAGVRTPLAVNGGFIVLSAVALIFLPNSHPYRWLRPFEWGVPAAALVWAFVASEERMPFARWGAPLLLGDSSYALYLFHPIALSVAFAVLKRAHLVLPFASQMALGLIGCIVASVFIHLLVERRVVAWASQLLRLKKMPVEIGMNSAGQVTGPAAG